MRVQVVMSKQQKRVRVMQYRMHADIEVDRDCGEVGTGGRLILPLSPSCSSISSKRHQVQCWTPEAGNDGVHHHYDYGMVVPIIVLC